MAEQLDVEIATDPQGSLMCKAKQHFVAKRGSTVKFTFKEFPKAELVFPDGSPFEGGNRLTVGPHKVKDDLPAGNQGTGSLDFKYDIEWKEPQGTGHGNGTGEVPPPG